MFEKNRKQSAPLDHPPEQYQHCKTTVPTAPRSRAWAMAVPPVAPWRRAVPKTSKAKRGSKLKSKLSYLEATFLGKWDARGRRNILGCSDTTIQSVSDLREKAMSCSRVKTTSSCTVNPHTGIGNTVAPARGFRLRALSYEQAGTKNGTLLYSKQLLPFALSPAACSDRPVCLACRPRRKPPRTRSRGSRHSPGFGFRRFGLRFEAVGLFRV